MVGHHQSVVTVTVCTAEKQPKTVCLLHSEQYSVDSSVFLFLLPFCNRFCNLNEQVSVAGWPQTCDLSLNTLNIQCFSAFFTPLNPPGLLPQREWWTGVYPFDSQQWMGPVVAVWCVCNEKVSVLLHHAKDNFLGVILICLYSTLTCWHVLQVCIRWALGDL